MIISVISGLKKSQVPNLMSHVSHLKSTNQHQITKSTNNQINMKNIATTIAAVIVLGYAATVTVIAASYSKRSKFQEKQITALNENLKKAIEKTAISFSINPEITHKITSAFGSTKFLTVQYYFTLDGNAMITQPDSVYNIVKEYKKNEK